MFAKLFESKTYGQLLITKEYKNDRPTLTCRAESIGIGTGESNLMFSEVPEGWNELDAAFEAADIDVAEGLAYEIHKAMGVLSPCEG